MTDNKLKYAPAHILWVDLETTGTDEKAKGSAILEIALVLTKGDAELTVLSEYTACIHPSRPIFMNQRALNMHNKSGLIAAIAEEGLVEHQVTDGIEKFLREGTEVGVDWSKTPLGGSSVHFDRRWLLASGWETLVTILSHRLFDVTPLRMAYEMFRGESLSDVAPTLFVGSATPHRALDDIRYSIAVARAFANRINDINLDPEIETSDG